MVERNGQTPRVSIPLDPAEQAVVWAYADKVEAAIGERPDYFDTSGGFRWFLCRNAGQQPDARHDWIYLREDRFRQAYPW